MSLYDLDGPTLSKLEELRESYCRQTGKNLSSEELIGNIINAMSATERLTCLEAILDKLSPHLGSSEE